MTAIPSTMPSDNCASSDDVSGVQAHCQMLGAQAAQLPESQNALPSETMMTQNFRDLSGQTISQTAKHLLELLMHSAPKRLSTVPDPKTELAGPQVPDKAPQPNDVDDLLASLGF